MSAAPSARPQPQPRRSYRVFMPVGTRWMDNDVYGHVNNVVYYSYFDTAVNRYLIESGVLDPATSPVIGLVAHTECDYFSSLSFPQDLEAGLRVARLGDSSVHYEVGIFARGESLCAASGRFVHIYVDRATRRPVTLPQPLRDALQLLVPTAAPAAP